LVQRPYTQPSPTFKGSSRLGWNHLKNRVTPAANPDKFRMHQSSRWT